MTTPRRSPLHDLSEETRALLARLESSARLAPDALSMTLLNAALVQSLRNQQAILETLSALVPHGQLAPHGPGAALATAPSPPAGPQAAIAQASPTSAATGVVVRAIATRASPSNLARDAATSRNGSQANASQANASQANASQGNASPARDHHEKDPLAKGDTPPKGLVATDTSTEALAQDSATSDSKDRTTAGTAPGGAIFPEEVDPGDDAESKTDGTEPSLLAPVWVPISSSSTDPDVRLVPSPSADAAPPTETGPAAEPTRPEGAAHPVLTGRRARAVVAEFDHRDRLFERGLERLNMWLSAGRGGIPFQKRESHAYLNLGASSDTMLARIEQELMSREGFSTRLGKLVVEGLVGEVVIYTKHAQENA